jgi:hypothetical protein
MDNIFSFAILDVPPGPENNNKLMRSKLNEIAEYVGVKLLRIIKVV